MVPARYNLLDLPQLVEAMPSLIVGLPHHGNRRRPRRAARVERRGDNLSRRGRGPVVAPNGARAASVSHAYATIRRRGLQHSS